MLARRPRASSLEPSLQRSPTARDAAARRRSLHAPASAPQSSTPCQGFVRLKRRGALTWSTRFVVLRGAELAVFHGKQDADCRRAPANVVLLAGGRLSSPASDMGVEFVLQDGREWLGRAFSRADLAMWATAFHRLALAAAAAVPRAPPRSGQQRRVSFHPSVLVRTIPPLATERKAELFYSPRDVETFSAQAASLRCRTEDAVAAAFAFRRRPLPPREARRLV